ncbi:GUN4 domain-containing protein [Oscillatoria sp. FACHB-1407]|uniref:GUN4 domain-containing protein n=1 Tax=Oscillatoria sp. FACHB-1407 TaxID=2692847 RepID=UPI0016822EAC|nr:GUN4 domain-containing protein [Oscillatoria sp. FACHB-1407]MBD2460252.1 GUN4 domain-containing protein [Oscillatoria sp. FACHB-1407]
MTDRFDQPQANDAVLGGHGAIPVGAPVLGGWAGIKQRLTSPIAEQRIAALSEALQHGQQGLYLVMRALRDESADVRQTAYALLHDRSEPRVKQAIAYYYTQEHYSRLKTVLSRGQWQEADQETKAALFRACGLELREQFRPEFIAKIPCRDLQVIDRLWMKYSRGRFGFSVQRPIWQRYFDFYAEKSDVWMAFADRVGWRVNNLLVQNHWKRYGEITFSLSAPVGHLPFLGDTFGIFTIEAIAKRLTQCELE